MLSASFKTCPACQARASADCHFCPSCGFNLREVMATEGDPNVGQVLADKYVVEELIGEGAMGRVYKAKQVTLGKPFAVKILAPHLMNDEASAARFANEAHNCASLNHPNCVSVVDYGRSPDGVTFIVMEYIQGRTLEAIISQEHPLARDRIVDLALQILSALSEAHGLGILHRDLKPENILVQQLRTHGELAKVLDFGIAKLMEEQTNGAARLTSQGMVCGTPEYMSPEQARGHNLDPRSDLYSVGVILYQMLTGRPPFESESAVEILHKHLHEAPKPPSEVLGSPPDPLEAVCLRAMAKNPDQRWSSAVEFREALIAATSPAASPGASQLTCVRCGAQMRSDHRFCPSCGSPAPRQRSEGRPTRPKHKTSSGLTTRSAGTEATAEVVVRTFPLPLVGRQQLLSAFRTRLGRQAAGLDVAVLAGPRGIGKTRFGDEIASLAEATGWRPYYVSADPTGARTPLWPIQVMVAQLLELDLTTVTTKDLGRAANLTGLAFEELPGLAELFELHGPAHDLELAVRRRECFCSAVGALLSGGRGQPLLLLFDDIDGFDTPSREILRRLAQARCDSPVMVVCTSTETDLDWLNARVETLRPLEAPDVERVARKITMSINPSSQLPALLAEQAPITPLTLENYLRLLASGQDVDEGWNETALLRARLEALDPAVAHVLELASILGERLLETDLLELFERDAQSPAGIHLFDEALAELHREGLLLVIGHGERAFAHGSLLELASKNMTEGRRRDLHRLAARTSRVAAHSVTVRAVHLVRANVADAVEALSEAAIRAERTFDDPAAAEYLLAALDASARLAPDERDAAREIELVLDCARIMREAQIPGRAIDLLERALRRPGLTPARETRLHTSLAMVRASLDQTTKALESIQRAVGTSIATGDQSLMLRVYLELGKILAGAGRLEEAAKELEEGLDLCTLGEGPRADTDLDLWRYLLKISETLRARSEFTQARRWCEHALFQAERHHDRLGLLRCHAQMAWVLRDLDQLALAETHVARALEEARNFGDRLTTAELLIERARGRAARGQRREARRCCEEALRLAQGMQWNAGIEHARRAIAMLTRDVEPSRRP